MTDKDFFEGIGYLSSREIKIDVEVKEGGPAKKFEIEYLELTGEPAEGLPDYHKISDKWGRELRVYISNLDNIPNHLSKEVRSNSYNEYEGRINNNDLVMRMFEYGFRIGAEQDLRRVSSMIPENFRSDFVKGSQI